MPGAKPRLTRPSVTKTLREGGTGAILFNIEESEGDEIFDKAADAWKRHGKWKTRNTEKTWYGHVEWYCNQKHGQETTWWINGGNLRSTKQWNFGNPIETENWYTTKGDLYEVHDWRQKCVHKRPTVTVCDTGETERDCWKCKRQSAGSYKHSSSPYHR